MQEFVIILLQSSYYLNFLWESQYNFDVLAKLHIIMSCKEQTVKYIQWKLLCCPIPFLIFELLL